MDRFHIQQQTGRLEIITDSMAIYDVDHRVSAAYLDLLFLLSPDSKRDKPSSGRQRRVRGIIKDHDAREHVKQRASVVGKVLVGDLLQMDIRGALDARGET